VEGQTSDGRIEGMTGQTGGWVKVKAVPLPKSERRYISYSFSTSALDGVSCQHHAPAVLYPRKRSSDTHWIGG
jgi:hypothetical protein